MTLAIAGMVIWFSMNRLHHNKLVWEQQDSTPYKVEEVAFAKEASHLITISISQDFYKPSVKFYETGYHHLALRWSDDELWLYPWLIQRSKEPEFITPTSLKNNQAADNTGNGKFRWLGINANNYVDIDDLEEETVYYYRIGAVTNMSEHRSNGVAPTFTEWKYGTATTKRLDPKRKKVIDVTDPVYGAVPGDGLNDYPAILKALKQAQKSRGGIIFLPSGEYDLWPTDQDVEIIDGLPTLTSRGQVEAALFRITRENITFLGEERDGNPDTFLKLYLWGKEPATKYLSILNRKGIPEKAKRYFLFYLAGAENFTLKKPGYRCRCSTRKCR